MTTVTTKNGINLDQLTETVEAVKEDSSLGVFTFRAASNWVRGTHNTGSVRDSLANAVSVKTTLEVL